MRAASTPREFSIAFGRRPPKNHGELTRATLITGHVPLAPESPRSDFGDSSFVAGLFVPLGLMPYRSKSTEMPRRSPTAANSLGAGDISDGWALRV